MTNTQEKIDDLRKLIGPLIIIDEMKKNKMKKLLLTVLVGLFIIGISTTAQAVVLTPGTGSLNAGSGSLGGATLATLVVPSSAVNIVTPSYHFEGTLTQLVKSNATGILF